MRPLLGDSDHSAAVYGTVLRVPFAAEDVYYIQAARPHRRNLHTPVKLMVNCFDHINC